MGQVIAFYGAKGGVGTTTLAINAAIALQRQLHRSVVLVDANLQFGDHRVFLDVGNDRYSIVDAVTAPAIDADLLSTLVVHHDSGIDLLVAPTRPEEAEHISAERHHMATLIETLRRMYDYVVVDLDKRLDDHCLDVIAAADRLLVVMTADLSCIKNVRLVLETMTQIGVPDERWSWCSTAATRTPASARGRSRRSSSAPSSTRWSTTTGRPSAPSTAASRSSRRARTRRSPAPSWSSCGPSTAIPGSAATRPQPVPHRRRRPSRRPRSGPAGPMSRWPSEPDVSRAVRSPGTRLRACLRRW